VSRSCRLLLAVLALLLIAAAPASAARRHRHRSHHQHLVKMIWGPLSLANGKSAFPVYRRLGVKVLELNLPWDEIAPTKPADATNPHDPAYQWPAYLTVGIDEAIKAHIQVCLMAITAPTWATGWSNELSPPIDPSDFGAFMTAAAREYPSVHRWMIWGEANREENFWVDSPGYGGVGPRTYALMLNDSYHALKRVSKSNLVIGADSASFATIQPATWLREMKLPDGKPPPLDYYGLNPYSFRFPQYHRHLCCHGLRDIDSLPQFESEVRRVYHRRVPLWLAEYSVSSDHNNISFVFHVSRRAQARWLTAAYKLAATYRFVAALGWFDLADQPPSVFGHLTTGLMTWQFKPKPAFYAYEHAP
jgi:hypothetical protein